MNARRDEPRIVSLGALVFVAAAAAFAPALDGSFVQWDDVLYLRDNPWIRGLGRENLRWMLTATRGGLWQPLTWLSWALDYRLWGPQPWGFHLTNVLLHACGACVFFAIALRFLGRPWAAAFAALFFAVHPLRVESVAWASERKDVLSGVFWLAAVWAWLAERRKVSIGFFALSLASKASGIMLPALLWIVDRARGLKRPARVYVPHAALAVLAALPHLAAARSEALLKPRGLAWSAAQTLYSLTFYPLKTAWPSGLLPYYAPLPWFGTWPLALAGRAFFVVLLIAAVVWIARRRFAVGWAAAAYAVCLAPVSGVIQQGVAARAFDHFTYLPCLSFALLFGAAADRGKIARVAAAVWLAALGALSRRQCGVWRDSLTLWTTVAAREPSPFAQANAGAALLEAGRVEESYALLREAARADPSQAVARRDLGLASNDLGLTRAGQGRTDEARALYRAAMREPASRAVGAYNLGNLLLAGGDARGAERLYREALRLDPGLARARVNLANTLARRGRLGEAAALYRAALRDEPGLAEARENLSTVERLLRR